MYFIGNNHWEHFGQSIERRKTLKACTWNDEWNDSIPTKIALGPSHALYLFASGTNNSVIVSGRNKHGQCGINNEFEDIARIQQLPFSSSLSIRSIFTNHSSHHSFIQTNSNEIYAFGWNKYQQLGVNRDLNQEEDIATPTKLILPQWIQSQLKKKDESGSEYFVDTIATAYDHTLLLCTNGNVYKSMKQNEASNMWRNVFGERPKIAQVAVGEEHDIFRDIYGRIWTLGHNNCAQLGIGSRDDDESINPHMLPIFDGKNAAVDIAAGRDHNLVVVQNGDVFAFGFNNYSQCGRDHDETQYVVKPSKIEALSFIDKVKAGQYHNAAIKMKDKEIFMWGHNINNECVTAPDDNIVRVPLAINECVRQQTGRNVKDVILGVSCSIVLVEDEQSIKDEKEENDETQSGEKDEKEREVFEDEAYRRKVAAKARQIALENEELRAELEGLREELEVASAQSMKDKEANERLADENRRLRRELNEKLTEKEEIKWCVWDSDKVTDWMMNIDSEYKKYENVLRARLKQEGIDGSVLSAIDKDDLQLFGISSLRHKLQIITKIRDLCARK